MTVVRPYVGYGRASVMKSPVEETDHNGIIVPIVYDGDHGVERGVIIAVAYAPDRGTSEALEPGTAVYYRGGVKIYDVLIVDLYDVIAYEGDS